MAEDSKQKIYDYLDHPPQRYEKKPNSLLMQEAKDGAWVRFSDMDLYMLEGGQLMKQAAMERDACLKLNAEQAETIERLRSELETERLRLAACGVAALADTPKTAGERLTRESPYWSASYGDVCRMVDRLMGMRAALHGVGRWLHSKEGTSLPQPLLDQINEALRGATEPKPLPTESAKGATAVESTLAPLGSRD